MAPCSPLSNGYAAIDSRNKINRNNIYVDCIKKLLVCPKILFAKMNFNAEVDVTTSNNTCCWDY